MKSFAIATVLTLFAALSQAAPTEKRDSPYPVTITFQGAPADVAFYTEEVPTDGTIAYFSKSPQSKFLSLRSHVILRLQLNSIVRLYER